MTRAALWTLRHRLLGLTAICAVASLAVVATVAPGGPPDDASNIPSEPIRPVPPVPPQDPVRVTLGEALFSDPILSHAGDQACSSGHDLRSNGADARKTDSGPNEVPLNNTNTVFNAALSYRFNWSGDAHTLEVEAEGSLLSHGLIATTISEVVGKLRADPGLSARFQQAYGREPDGEALLDALATFERTPTTLDSRFDLWLRGDRTAISADELEGYRLFKSAGCVSCHQGTNVGGNLLEKNGIFQPLTASEPRRMRVPSLRNVAATAPYFHDGSTPTLTEAVGKMARAQLGRSLSPRQIGLIVAFLGTLTGRCHGHPVTAAP